MPSTLVLDSSTAIDLLSGGAIEATLRRRLFAPSVALVAPELIDLEVAHAVRRGWLLDRSTLPRALEMLWGFARLPIERHPHGPLIDRIWELRNNLTAYDAAYVALAEKLDATLITRDARMARSSGHEARIEYVE